MEEETGETEAGLAYCGNATDMVKTLCGPSLAVETGKPECGHEDAGFAD